MSLKALTTRLTVAICVGFCVLSTGIAQDEVVKGTESVTPLPTQHLGPVKQPGPVNPATSSVPDNQIPQSAVTGQSAGKSEEELLAELRDVYLPAEPGWWPPAPGWWIATLVLLVAIGSFALWLRRRLNHRRLHNWKKSALEEHSRLKNLADTQAAPSIQIIAQASILMRRVSLSQLPRQQIASITDHQWLATLDLLGNTSEYSEGAGQLLTRHPYMRAHDVSTASVNDLLTLIKKTIIALPSTLHSTDKKSSRLPTNDQAGLAPYAVNEGATKVV